MALYDFVAQDTGSILTVNIKDQDGNALDLSGYLAVRIFWRIGIVSRSGQMTVSDAANGVAYYQFSGKNDLIPGTMSVEIETEDASSYKKTSRDLLTYTVRDRIWR